MLLSDSKFSPKVAILDYGMGNLRSVHRAFQTVGADARIVDHPGELDQVQALIFPGQGAIVDTMARLQDSGWDQYIRDWIQADRPFFGICLGLQALFEFSEEGNTRGLGIFPGKVVRFTAGEGFHNKIPHMGWNIVNFRHEDSLLDGMDPHQASFYFVHSYFVESEDEGIIWGTTHHSGVKFCSAIRRGNLVATQFHPEKSQAMGLRLYRNFINSIRI